MKYYITKYVLTQGILEREGNVWRDDVKTINVKEEGALNGGSLYFKPFWHDTREEAIAHAEKLREAKLKSIEKQIKKIKTLKF